MPLDNVCSGRLCHHDSAPLTHRFCSTTHTHRRAELVCQTAISWRHCTCILSSVCLSFPFTCGYSRGKQNGSRLFIFSLLLKRQHRKMHAVHFFCAAVGMLAIAGSPLMKDNDRGAHCQEPHVAERPHAIDTSRLALAV